MSTIVLKAEGVSKRYRLGSIGSGSLRRDFNQWWQQSVLRKDAAYYRGAEETALNDEYFWALRDINFEIRQGEAWGIIGKNGAGKSTLLKILSRIIKPTTGIVQGKGKVSSLLEVGTGFHPELTGKENIYISGHIHGMNRNEINKRFDQIVEFSGVSDFLDTPVKRYSSGMYVRLAFAVAAHLEPDILIIDEVLAVGDAEFQKKCIAKMNEVTNESGRTILFVSHNLQAVTNLCSNSMWLDKGNLAATGDSKTMVNKYLGGLQKKSGKQEFDLNTNAPGNEHIKIKSLDLVPDLEDSLQPIDIRTRLTIKFSFYNGDENTSLSVDILLYTITGECVFDVPSKPAVYNKGIIEGECEIPGNFLNDGSYYISLYFVKDTSVELFSYNECLFFDVADFREGMNWYDKWWGIVRPSFPVTLRQTNK